MMLKHQLDYLQQSASALAFGAVLVCATTLVALQLLVNAFKRRWPGLARAGEAGRSKPMSDGRAAGDGQQDGARRAGDWLSDPEVDALLARRARQPASGDERVGAREETSNISSTGSARSGAGASK